MHECACPPAHVFLCTSPPPNIINLAGMEGSFLGSPGLFQAVLWGFKEAKNTTCYNGGSF